MGTKHVKLKQTAFTAEDLKKVEVDILKTLVEIDTVTTGEVSGYAKKVIAASGAYIAEKRPKPGLSLSTRGQASKVVNGALANGATYAGLSKFLPTSWETYNSIIASGVGALTNTFTNAQTGQGPGWRLSFWDWFNNILSNIESIFISANLRGFMPVISGGNEIAQYVLTLIIPGIIQGLRDNEAGKGFAAREKIKRLNNLIAQHIEIAKAIDKHSPFDNAPLSEIIVPLSDSDQIQDEKITKQRRLNEVENRLTVLADKFGGLGLIKQAGIVTPGFVLNGGTFIALSTLLPGGPAGLPMLNAGISSLVGSLTDAVMEKVTGQDRGPWDKTVVRVLDGVNVSEGVRLVANLVPVSAFGNHEMIQLIFRAVLPALVQSHWYHDSVKHGTMQEELVKLKSLLIEHAKLSQELRPTESEKDEVIQGKLKNDDSKDTKDTKEDIEDRAYEVKPSETSSPFNEENLEALNNSLKTR